MTSRAYKGKGVIWCNETNKPLVAFVKGCAVVSDPKTQSKLDDMGYESEPVMSDPVHEPVEMPKVLDKTVKPVKTVQVTKELPHTHG